MPNSTAQSAREVIDITPTWGEVGRIVSMLAESGERQACKAMRSEIARAFAMAAALNALSRTLTDAQRDLQARVLTEELTKQGY